ncbi:unnamed protein product [Ceutorhynchus assimilis]|uniref:Uncharacterized protein n=1 Tax=Ceutorhynchus assimilis TaxID=467358 RepID=A0A9N9QJN8_9CUCU|nr:unnamed protein product [Ceutorhynchus assimilis]
MVLNLNETSNDKQCDNTDRIEVIDECIMTEDGFLQSIDPSDATEFFVPVANDVAVVDLETVGETGVESGDRNDEQTRGYFEENQMETEDEATEIEEEICGFQENQNAIDYEIDTVMDESDAYIPEEHSESSDDAPSDLENQDPREERGQIGDETDVVEDVENNNEGPPRKKRRRVYLKQDATYLQNKKNRELGRAYQSKKKVDNKWNYNIEKPGKQMKNGCSCKLGKANSVLKCSEVIQKYRQEIFDKFWKMTWPEKKQYAVGLISLEQVKRRRGTTENSRRNYSYKYYLKCSNLKTYRVCKKMFTRTLGVSENVVLLWLEKNNSMTQDNDEERVERPRRENEKTKSINQLKIFFTSLSKMESHYCRASTSKLYLEPLWQSKRELFRFYKNTWCVEQNAQATKKDQCDICMGYKTKNISDEIYQEHLALKEEARSEKSRDKLSENDVVLTVDLQSVLLAPKSKVSLMYYKTKLAVHNYTLYDIKSNDGYCFLWSEVEGSLGANEFSSILTYFIENMILPKIDKSLAKIILWSDGCVAQNRNNVLSNALLNIAIKHNVVILQKFLYKGHTQMEADSMHSVIERRLRNRDINVPADYVQYCSTARLNPRPYFVKYCTFNFFKNFDGVRFHNSIRPGRKAGDPVVTDLKQIRVVQPKMGKNRRKKHRTSSSSSSRASRSPKRRMLDHHRNRSRSHEVQDFHQEIADMQKRLDELKRSRNVKNENVERMSQNRNVRDSRSPASHHFSVRDSRSPATPEKRVRGSRSPASSQIINLVDNDPLDQVPECWGEDPEVGKINYFDLHPQLTKRVNYIASNGLDKETQNHLANKYPSPKGVHIGPPILNPEVVATMGPTGLTKDKFQISFQEENAKGISNLLYAVNKLINDEREEVPKAEYIELLSDTTRHYTNLQHKLSLQRRSFINQNLNKLVVDLSVTTPVDTFLYGENLGERIKTAKAAEKEDGVKSSTGPEGLSPIEPPPASSFSKIQPSELPKQNLLQNTEEKQVKAKKNNEISESAGKEPQPGCSYQNTDIASCSPNFDNDEDEDQLMETDNIDVDVESEAERAIDIMPTSAAKKQGPSGSKKKDKKKFVASWCQMPIFQGWLEKSSKAPNQDKNEFAFCKVCQMDIVAHKSVLVSHSKTEKHKLNYLRGAKNTKIDDLFKGKTANDVSVKIAELKLCSMLATNDLSFLLMDTLTPLLKNVFPDSKIAQDIQLKRTKATAVCKSLGDNFLFDLYSKIKDPGSFFSIIMDETTDISVKKQCAFTVIYFDNIDNKPKTRFFDLVEPQGSSAVELFTALKESVVSKNIPFSNLVGFSSDTTNAMVGEYNSVFFHLKEELPSIVCIRCSCHMAHLATSKACLQLPRRVEDLLRNIGSHFNRSALRR